MTTYLTEFSRALDEAMSATGLSLHAISRRLHEAGAPLAPSTLSYWRSGQRRPERSTSWDALAALEDVLDVDSGALSDLVGPSRRAPPEHFVDHGELVGAAGGLRPLLQALEVDEDERHALVPTGVTLSVDVDADGHVVSTLARVLWRARRDGAHRAFVYVPVRAAPDRLPQVVAGSGTRTGRVRHDPAMGLMAVELVLERPLEVNETVITECTVQGRQSPGATDIYGWVVESRVVEAVLWVRFSSARVPASCSRYADSDVGTDEAPVRLHGTTAHVVVRSFGPGAFGLRWTWPHQAQRSPARPGP